LSFKFKPLFHKIFRDPNIPQLEATETAYTFFASINNIAWKPPKYKQERKLPFIPLESELDALISSAHKKIATALQLLKETSMRIGEACRLKWIDIDLERNCITLNAPEKGSQPRMFKISPRLVAMLNVLPKENEYVFGRMKPRQACFNLSRLRKRVAYKLQNPRINSIHLHTFRHWNATMEYHKTKDILHVMRRLGHKRIENTLIYTQLVQFESDEFHSATTEDIDEDKKLIEAGLEYVCTHENLMLFRKRK
jgi:integrase